MAVQGGSNADHVCLGEKRTSHPTASRLLFLPCFDIFDFSIFLIVLIFLEIVITHKMRWLDVNADFNMDYVFRCGI